MEFSKKKPIKTFASKMPHSNFKERYYPLGSEVMKCACCQTFVFESDRGQDMKIRMHEKVCSRLIKGLTYIKVFKKAMTLREQQHAEVERLRKVYENH